MADGNQTWRTPDWLFKLLEREVGRKLVLDAAASKVNAKCKRFYTEAENGLLQPWADGTFINPGFAIFGAWMKRAVEWAREHEHRVVLIGPKGCSQLWFHRYARQGVIFAPDQRIPFCHYETGEQTRAAREDSMAYVVGPGFWNKKSVDFDLRSLPVRQLIEQAIRGAP